MPQSLLGGRNTAPLDEQQVRRVVNTFMGLDDALGWSAMHDPNGATRFVVETDENQEEVGKIYFGSDILPGRSISNPNSALSMKAAAAHELSHFHRWRDAGELPHGERKHLDEAFTSLQAALRYEPKLDDSDVRGLISDALERLRLHLAELDAAAPAKAPAAEAAVETK